MYARSNSSAIAALEVDLPERYESLHLLARGGMGAVYRAYDGVLGRMVAIKLLAEGYADDERAVGRFLREARAAARLSGHRHVVTIYDVGDAAGRPYLVMEHLAGGTVADALRLGAATSGNALRWIGEAALALDHAHDLGVLHRDVKPANMLLSRDRVLHLADFGIARLAAEHAITSVNEMLGTAAYMSPEQIRGEPATAASDRYALAVTAFELLVGERPFQAKHFAGLARAHQEAPRPSACARNPRLPPSIDAVLARGMARRPEDRCESAHAFAAALMEALPAASEADATVRLGAAGSPRRPAPAGTPRRPAPAVLMVGSGGGRPGKLGERSRPARRRPTPRVAAIAALAAGALASGALLAAGPGSGAPHSPPVAQARTGAHARPLRPGKRNGSRAAGPAKVVTAQGPASPAGAQGPASTAGAQGPASTTGAQALEARGHQLMVAGDYQAAIPALRQALQVASPDSLTYAYALFDLGRSLRLAGEASAAVPVLEQRLKIPDQPGVVSHELKLALDESGPRQAAGAKPAPVPGAGGPGPRDGSAQGRGGPGGAKQRNRSFGPGD